MEIHEIKATGQQLREQIHRVLVGQDAAINLVMVALLCEGHVLLEGLPGTAKTLLAQSFAACLSLRSNRIQFTPDLMPGDVIGTNLFDFQSNRFSLTKGPIFTDILLADEINRTPPKTQAALLQPMQERAVSIDGTTHELGPGFMVLATQNPIEHEGTYPLPEAQLDRFLFKIRINYPARDQECAIVRLHGHRTAMPRPADFGVSPVTELETIERMRATVAAVRLGDELVEYIVDLVRATREEPTLLCGASPRAANMLAAAARAVALLNGREYVIPDDVKSLTLPLLGHRILMAPAAEIEGLDTDRIVKQIVERVPAPR